MFPLTVAVAVAAGLAVGRLETLLLHRQSRWSPSSGQSSLKDQAYLDKIWGLCIARAGVAALAKARELGRWANTEAF